MNRREFFRMLPAGLAAICGVVLTDTAMAAEDEEPPSEVVKQPNEIDSEWLAQALWDTPIQEADGGYLAFGIGSDFLYDDQPEWYLPLEGGGGAALANTGLGGRGAGEKGG